MAALAKQLIRRLMVVLAGCLCFSLVSPPAAAESDPKNADSAAILQNYAAAARAGDAVSALGYLLDYEVLTRGENAPQTARLTHRYGVLLLRKGKYLEATKVLKTALERSDAAFGEFAGEAFDINMNIGYAYSHLGRRVIYSPKYFDRALEVLRQRGERETIRYVTVLLNIAGTLVDNDALSGDATPTVTTDTLVPGIIVNGVDLQFHYRNSFYKAKKYLEEAAELAEKLVDEDKYLPAKVAIAQAKIDILETADLAKVPAGVSGGITQKAAVRRNDRTEARLTAAITELAEDPAANSVSLDAAHATLLDIAWLDNDRGRMEAMCASGALDSSADFPSERLFRIGEDGNVIAPNFSFYVPSNIFRNRMRPTGPLKDENGNRIPYPYYIPVCIDGELMAALINAPRVIIEEYK